MKIAGPVKILLPFLFLFILSEFSFADTDQYKNFIEGSLSGAESDKETRNFSIDFKKQKSDREPLYPLYEQYVGKIGTKRIASVLEADSSSCHGVAHALGRLIGERVDNLNISMGICAATCTYACLHGVFKVYFSKLGKEYGSHKAMQGKQARTLFSEADLKQFGTDVNDACNESNTIVEGFYKGNCAHGVGHAMSRLAQDTALANKYCKVFTSADMQFYCESGVFMEFGDKLKRALFTGKLKRSEEIKIALTYCGKESFYPSACLRFLLPRNKSLGHVSRFSYFCSRQKANLKIHCYNAMGFYSRTYIANNPSEFLYICAIENVESRKACISGVALMKKGQKYREAIRLACSKLLDPIDRKFCQDQISKYYYKLDNDYFVVLLNS